VSGCLGLLLAAASALAQPVPGTGVRPGDRPLELPDLWREETEPGVAQPPPREPTQRLSGQIRVFVREIRLEGNTVFPDEQLRETVLDRYENRWLGTEDLVRLRNELTQQYVDAGYVNSGAIIPDQDVSDQVILVRIVEGKLPLDQIEINGLEILRDSYIRNRIALSVKDPLNVNPLRERLQLLLQNPMIETINARLGPGIRPGDSRLEVDVVEAPRFAVDAFANNDRPISVGEYQGGVSATARSVLGFGDPLYASGSFTEGLNDGYGSYAIPLTADDLRFFVSGEYTDAEVVQQPFDELDIESETWTVEFGLDYPFFRTPELEISGGASFARRHSQTSLLGRRFSFTEGADEGEVNVSVLRFVQNARWRGEEQVAAVRSTFSWGIDAWNATINDTGPDGRFFSWLGQTQYARRLGEPGHEIVLRGDLQVAADPLVSIEQYAVGGLFSVRGYRRNEIVRDSGWVASAEWRYPLLRLPIPRLSKTPEDGVFQVAPFFDAGGGWNHGRETPSPNAIYSIGAGVRWSPAQRFSLAVYYGYPLKDVSTEGDKGLQDYGVYFDVRIGVW
jgi:hemolysin activation/secretion protein